MKIGIDLGGSHIGIGLVNENNEIVDKIEKNWTTEEKKDLWNTIQKVIVGLIHQILEKNDIKQVESIGIGFPQSRIIDGIVYIKEEKIDLISLLKPIFNTNVYVRNDVKCSAICEKNIGNLKKYDNALFITLGTGIGGAYFYKNELVVPNKYPGFEIGHMIIDVNGKKCRCGKNGCFEEYASMRSFRSQIEELFNIEKVTSYKLVEIMESKEKLNEVNKIIDEYLTYLSIGLTNLINIFEPDTICIGGSFAYYESIFMDKLKEKVQANFENREIPDILVAKYANDAGIIGASMLESN